MPLLETGPETGHIVPWIIDQFHIQIGHGSMQVPRGIVFFGDARRQLEYMAEKPLQKRDFSDLFCAVRGIEIPQGIDVRLVPERNRLLVRTAGLQVAYLAKLLYEAHESHGVSIRGKNSRDGYMLGNEWRTDRTFIPLVPHQRVDFESMVTHRLDE